MTEKQRRKPWEPRDVTGTPEGGDLQIIGAGPRGEMPDAIDETGTGHTRGSTITGKGPSNKLNAQSGQQTDG